MKIAILDSGTAAQLPAFQDIQLQCFELDAMGRVVPGGTDNYGHGTAVASILARELPQAEFISIQIFNGEDGCTDETLLGALRYLLNESPCDFINISAGIAQGRIEELHEVCLKLKEKCCHIIAGFDNNGAVSYPAAFSCVYGVDLSSECKRNDEYVYVEHSIVNFLARGGTQNVLWCDGSMRLVAGTSFSTPYITALLAKQRMMGTGELSEIAIRNNAKSVITYPQSKQEDGLWNIKRAIAFPFNKEIHALCRFEAMLPFQLAGVYNFKYLGNIGSRVSDLLYSIEESALMIENIEALDWNGSFDTFILGHVEEMCNVLGEEFLQNILQNCLKHHKNLYAFESGWVTACIEEEFEDAGLRLLYPKVDISRVYPLRDKLYIPNTPSLTVLGTSSKQGKFSAQLLLRGELEAMGYRVGQLGTEPNALLFGADEMLAMGYRSGLKLTGPEVIAYINYLIHKIEKKDVDLILTGGQSNVLPYAICNLEQIPAYAYEFLLGVNPDAALLCVNLYEDVEYLRRCIRFIESAGGCKVLAFLVFPLRHRETWSAVHMEEDRYTKEEIIAYCQYLESEFHIRAVENSRCGVQAALEDVLTYLAEE